MEVKKDRGLWKRDCFLLCFVLLGSVMHSIVPWVQKVFLFFQSPDSSRRAYLLKMQQNDVFFGTAVLPGNIQSDLVQ